MDPNLGESLNKEEVIMDDEELILEIDDGPYELDFDSLELYQESWEWFHDQIVFEDNVTFSFCSRAIITGQSPPGGHQKAFCP